VFEVSVLGPDGGRCEYKGLLIQPDQRIVVVGTMGDDEGYLYLDLATVRYNS
jgi:hypothetical protein